MNIKISYIYVHDLNHGIQKFHSRRRKKNIQFRSSTWILDFDSPENAHVFIFTVIEKGDNIKCKSRHTTVKKFCQRSVLHRKKKHSRGRSKNKLVDQLRLKASSFLPIALQLQGDPVIDLLAFLQWQD